MRYYAVIDTNVLLSSLLTKNSDSATVKLLDMVENGTITPIFNRDILSEYDDVLHRAKFAISDTKVTDLMCALVKSGEYVERIEVNEQFLSDPDDAVFYEVVMAKRLVIQNDAEAYLVTGNLKHFPVTCYVVTPAEMLAIIERDK